MSRLPLGSLRRRPSAGRVVVALRAEARLIAELVPEPPILLRGRALLLAAFTCRTAMGGLLHRERLTWLCDGAPLVVDAATTQRCTHTADRFSIALRVTRAEELELALAAEACARPDDSVFPSAREAAAYLDAHDATRAEEGRHWEPLAPTHVEWRVPGLDEAAHRALEFDSAFRQVPVRLLPTPSALLGKVPRAGTAPIPARS